MAKARANLRKVRDGLAGLLEEGKEAAIDVSQKALQRGRDIHAQVQERGGYGNVVRESLEKAGEAITSVTRSYLDSADRLYGEFIEEFSTPEGEFDYDKAKAVMTDQAKAVQRFGKKSVDKVAELASTGASKAVTAWNYLVPTREERETTYSGIGSEYSGILLRPDYESCLDFYDEARRTMPGGLRSRGEILEVIKAKCCTSPDQLLNEYEQRAGQDTASLEVVRKYFSRSE